MEEWIVLSEGVVLNGVDLADLSQPLPERVGNFLLHGRLGQSKSGIVLEATTANGDRVALKFARPPLEAAERKEETARLLRELSVLKALSHPGIIRLVDAGLVGGLLYLAVERIEAVTLRALMEDSAAAFDVAAAIGLQVGSTIAHLHTVGVIQREITPDVLIVRPDGQVLLADFGFSTFVGAPAITDPGPPRGTLGYVAPELFESGKATHASDQYALGRLLFELCTPAERSSIQANHATPAERQSAGWVDWSTFPTGAYHRSLKPVLEKMLSPEPRGRYADVYTAVAEIATLAAYKGLVDAGLVGGRGRSSPQLRSMSGERALAAFVDQVQHLQDDEKSGPLWRTISDSFSDVGGPLYASSYLLIDPELLDRTQVLENVCLQAERFFAQRDAGRVADQLRDDARTFWEDRAKSAWTEEVTPMDPDPDASTAPGSDTDSGAITLIGGTPDEMISEETEDSSDPTDSYHSDPPDFLPVRGSTSDIIAPRDPVEEMEEQMHADTISEALVIPRTEIPTDPANEPALPPPAYSFEEIDQLEPKQEASVAPTRSKFDLAQILVAAALLLLGLLLGFFLGRS